MGNKSIGLLERIAKWFGKLNDNQNKEVKIECCECGYTDKLDKEGKLPPLWANIGDKLYCSNVCCAINSFRKNIIFKPNNIQSSSMEQEKNRNFIWKKIDK